LTEFKKCVILKKLLFKGKKLILIGLFMLNWMDFMELGKAIEQSLGDDFNLGTFIKGLRQCENIKSIDLAEKLGISRQELSQIEKNKANVSPKRAKEIAEAMGLYPGIFIELAVRDSLKRQGIEFEELKIKFKRPLVEQMAAS
jgi:transcriptional regulator with XRE-family HTH domain